MDIMNHKFKELVTDGVVFETLTEVAPRFEGVDVQKTLGITEHQQKKLEKKVTEKIVASLEQKFVEALEKGESVEIKGVAQFYIHKSAGYLNAKGEPKKSVKAKTRKAFSNKINQ